MECDHRGISGRLIAMASSFAASDALIEAMGTTRQNFLEYCSGKKEAPWVEIDRLIQFIVREQGTLIAEHRDATKGLRPSSGAGDTPED